MKSGICGCRGAFYFVVSVFVSRWRRVSLLLDNQVLNMSHELRPKKGIFMLGIMNQTATYGFTGIRTRYQLAMAIRKEELERELQFL